MVSNHLCAQNNLSLLVQKCKPSIFRIFTYDAEGKELASGTGFFINSKGICVSNYHVLAGASSAIIKTLNGKTYSINSIISESENFDLIKFSIKNPSNNIFPYLTLSQFKPSEGESVFTIGNPEGLEYSVSNGIISSIRNDKRIGQIIQTTAPISHGNSGSPLINMHGEVIGIISFTLFEGQNLNFAVSVSNLSLLSQVNSLRYPVAKNKTKNETSLKKFNWNVSSNEVLANESLTLKKKDKTDFRPEDYTLIYEAEIGNIEIEFNYDFKYDKLKFIRIEPIRDFANATYKAPKSAGLITDFETASTEFITIEKKLLQLLGDNYYECVGGQPGFCRTLDKYEQINGHLFTKNELQLNANDYFKGEKGNGFGYSSCTIIHRWVNETNGSYYDLGFRYDKEVGHVHGNDLQCNWYLVICPIMEYEK